MSSTCFSALADGVEAVVFAGSFFLGEDFAAEDFTEGEDAGLETFLSPESPEGLATATTGTTPLLQWLQRLTPICIAVQHQPCCSKICYICNWNFDYGRCAAEVLEKA